MLLMMFAGSLASGAGVYDILWLDAAVAGVGWGLVETCINPLIATLYPDNKTGKAEHAACLVARRAGHRRLAGRGDVEHRSQLAGEAGVVILPAIAVILLCVGVKFPPTERAAAGVSAKEMFRELRNPLFFVLFCSMFLTAASELAPGQWLDLALTRVVHMHGILLLVYANALMFLMRHFAGPLVHKLSPVGVLWFSCLGASLGLVALSFADSPVTGSAGGDGLGHRRLLHVADHAGYRFGAFPARRSVAHGIDGHGGHAVDSVCSSADGRIYDRKKVEVAGGEEAFNSYREAGWIAFSGSRRKLLPRCRDFAGYSADRFRRDLVLRPV